MFRSPKPLSGSIILWATIVGVFVVVLAVGLYTNLTLRSVEKMLPNELLSQLYNLTAVVESMAAAVHAAERAQSDPDAVNIMRLEQLVEEVFTKIVQLRDTYLFDNLVQAAALHAILAPAVIDARQWLAEGVSGYAPDSPMTLYIIHIRIDGAFDKAIVLRNEIHASARTILLEQGQRLERFLFSVNLLFAVTLLIALTMGILLQRRRALIAREVQARAEQQAAADRLRKSEERYRLLFEHAPLGLLHFDEEGRIVTCNDIFVRIIGSSRPQLIGLNMLQLPDQNIVASVQKALQGQVGLYEDLYNSVTAQKVTPVRALFAPVTMDDGSILGGVGIIEDITARKQAEAERETLQAQLMDARKMESVGLLAGGVAHDFNNLLQAIGGYAQLLMLGKAPENSEYVKLQAIQKSVERAAQLVQQLLLFSRKAPVTRRPIDLNQEVSQAVLLLRHAIPRMVTIDLNTADDLVAINADAMQMEQLLLNLGRNAADAMPDGGRLQIETRNVFLDQDYARTHLDVRPGNYVLLSVSDTGCGMDQKTRSHIFDPFFTTKEIGKGTGLGLASVYGIVKAHEGAILCYSEPQRGTIFKAYLPAADQEAHPQTDSEAPATARGGHETILVVDDEAVIRDLASDMLQRFGYTVLTAANGEETLERCAASDGAIDLVILDIGMPGMGGLQCLRQLLKHNPERHGGIAPPKVLIASGYSSENLLHEVRQAGAAGFIGKPYQIHELAVRVREVLDQ